MKPSRNKPRTRSVKKKRRKKFPTKDKIRAVLAAGIVISVAVIIALAVYYLHSAKVRSGAETQVEAAVMRSGENPPVTEGSPPETESSPLVIEGFPPVPAAAPRSQAPARPAPVTEKKPPQRPPANTRAEPPARPSPAAPAAEKRTPPPAKQAPESSPGTVIEQPPVPSAGSLAFVIDDAGNNLHDLEPFLKFPGPLTIAVLPGLPHSAEAARRIRAAGKEVFLHQPMEALGGTNPGPGAIMAGMGRDEIRAIISRNLDEIGPVAGINNHEGSRITMDEKAMETILALCREKGILFLDSRTTAETAAPRIARMLEMTIGERDVFIDNNQERTSMLNYINSGLARAGQKGSAIMIGHVWSPALAPLLAEIYPDLHAKGFTVSRASKLINGSKQ